MRPNESTLHETATPHFTARDDSDVDTSWFARLASAYLAKRLARANVTEADSAVTESERAKAAIRAACVRCALTGAASGTVTPLAELLTADTGGLAALATVPVAALTVGGEMVFRAVVHLGLVCDLAEIYGVHFDAKDRIAFWRLCALSADGRLSPEETAVLAYLVRLLPADERAAVMARFVEDERDWDQRLTELPENERDDFFHALEIAAMVDKVVTPPERRILRDAARVLGRSYDDARIARMVKEFGDVGVLRAWARQASGG